MAGKLAGVRVCCCTAAADSFAAASSVAWSDAAVVGWFTAGNFVPLPPSSPPNVVKLDVVVIMVACVAPTVVGGCGWKMEVVVREEVEEAVGAGEEGDG